MIDHPIPVTKCHGLYVVYMMACQKDRRYQTCGQNNKTISQRTIINVNKVSLTHENT